MKTLEPPPYPVGLVRAPILPPPARRARIVIPGNRGVKIVRSITIRRPASDLYAFWHNLENAVLVLKHPGTIMRLSEDESHWSVSAPLGDHRVEWTALIINDQPDRLIAWRSREGADVPNAGSIRFEPAVDGEGTDVTVQLEYDPPGGKLGAWLARLSPEAPHRQVEAALERFKTLMETGEFPFTESRFEGTARKTKRKSRGPGA